MVEIILAFSVCVYYYYHHNNHHHHRLAKNSSNRLKKKKLLLPEPHPFTVSSSYRHREPISVVGEVTEMVKRNPYGIYRYIYIYILLLQAS